MGDLVYLKNEEAVCDSLQVAEKFGKRHDVVLRAIDSLAETLPNIDNDSPQNCGQWFKPTWYKDASGKHNKMYYMNRDGFSLLVMGFTGKKALEWKLQYIKAFNEMEKFIREKSTNEWLETRKTGQITRKAETDVIKSLVEYAKNQGSEHAEMLYMTYSRLANKMAGITARDTATVIQLNHLTFIENIILNQVRIGMERGMHYKDIYQDCKKQIELFKAIAYLDSGIQINEVEQCTILQALPKMTNSL